MPRAERSEGPRGRPSLLESLSTPAVVRSGARNWLSLPLGVWGPRAAPRVQEDTERRPLRNLPLCFHSAYGEVKERSR